MPQFGWWPTRHSGTSSALPPLGVEHQPNLLVKDEDDPLGAWDLLRSGLLDKRELRKVSLEDPDSRHGSRGDPVKVVAVAAQVRKELAHQDRVKEEFRQVTDGLG